MYEVKEINFFFVGELDSLHLHHLVLVLLQPHVDDPSGRVQETHERFGQMEDDRLVFERPSVVLELLVGGLREAANFAGCTLLEVNPAAEEVGFFELYDFYFVLDVVEGYFFEKHCGFEHQKFVVDKRVQFFPHVEILLLHYNFAQSLQKPPDLLCGLVLLQ